MTKTARGRLVSLVARLRHHDGLPWVLEGEDCARIENPSLDRLRLQLSRLRASGPSFVCLSAPDGSYLQAAGARSRLSVELHQEGRKKPHHSVVGRFDTDDSDAFVHASFGRLDVLRSEVMSLAEAAELFEYFQHFRRIPPHFQLRDVTAEVAAATALS